MGDDNYPRQLGSNRIPQKARWAKFRVESSRPVTIVHIRSNGTLLADCAEEDCNGAEGEWARVKVANKTV